MNYDHTYIFYFMIIVYIIFRYFRIILAICNQRYLKIFWLIELFDEIQSAYGLFLHPSQIFCL